MLVYFELHFDDANGYWIDNIKETNQKIKSKSGFDIKNIKHNTSDYGINVDLNLKYYHSGDNLNSILYEFKKDYLLELRKKKINKLIENKNIFCIL